MTPPLDHDHELDGALHDGCPMCEHIRERVATVRSRDDAADRLADRYAAVANRAPARVFGGRKRP